MQTKTMYVRMQLKSKFYLFLPVTLIGVCFKTYHELKCYLMSADGQNPLYFSTMAQYYQFLTNPCPFAFRFTLNMTQYNNKSQFVVELVNFSIFEKYMYIFESDSS